MTSTNTFLHDPNALLDYSVDFSLWLAAGETITAQTVAVPTGVTLNPSGKTTTQAGGVVTFWITGGTVGERYDCVCHITTSTGRQDDRTIHLQVLSR